MNEEQTTKSRFSLKEAFLSWAGLLLVLLAVIIVYLVITNFGKIWHVGIVFLKLIKPVIYGAVIAYLVNPLCKFYQRLLRKPFQNGEKELSDKMKRIIDSVCIALGLITGIFIILVLGWLLLPQIYISVLAMVDTLPNQANFYYQKLTDWVQGNPMIANRIQEGLLQITDYLDGKINTELFPWLQQVLIPNMNTYAKQFANGVMSFFNVLYNLFIGVIVALYLLGGKRQFLAQSKKILYSIFRKDYADVVVHYVQLTNQMFSGFIVGKIVDSTIIGVICFLVMSLFRWPYPLLVSVIVGVTNIIPVFGPYIGAVPSFFLILLVNPIQALYFLIFVIILQQLDGNIIGPTILGESTGLSAFWVLFAILLFGGLWGLVGMLVGVPLFAVIYRIIADVVNAGLRRRQLSTETEHYKDLKEIITGEDGFVFVKYTESELIGKMTKSPKKESDFMKSLRHVWKDKSQTANPQENIQEEDVLSVEEQKEKE
ncbi:MAG: AI-2E family transporter [Lachnospiraceae bacterium]|nr:AI-2E family transporter [Lachnospiraceae bacterium]